MPQHWPQYSALAGQRDQPRGASAGGGKQAWQMTAGQPNGPGGPHPFMGRRLLTPVVKAPRVTFVFQGKGHDKEETA